LTLAAGQDLGLCVLPFAELEQVDQLLRRAWVRVEAPEQVDDLDHGQLRVERGRLETDANAWLERVRAVGDVEAEDDRLAAIGRPQAFEDLDRRRLARAVRPEQAEDLARGDIEIDAIDGLDLAVTLDQPPNADDRLPGVRGGGTLPRRGPGGQSFFLR
jgi:hypothetical protein